MSAYDTWLTTQDDPPKCVDCKREAPIHKDGMCRECWDQGRADAQEGRDDA